MHPFMGQVLAAVLNVYHWNGVHCLFPELWWVLGVSEGGGMFECIGVCGGMFECVGVWDV